MFFRLYLIKLLTLLCIFFSCSEPTSPKDKTGTVTDIDGNTYKTVKIGDQWWMAENLKVTHYRNGDAIPNVKDKTEWLNLTTDAYCSYNNDDTYIPTYGLLYNWYAVDDSRNIAPEDWHVPSDTEWEILAVYLGRYPVAGGKMKATGTIEGGDGLWHEPNEGATNESGFSALPGGCVGCSYSGVGLVAYFWAGNEFEYDSRYVWFRVLYYFTSDLGRSYLGNKPLGFSVRCIKD